MFDERLEDYMRMALAEAYEAFEQGEVPVGAVVIYNDRIIGRGHNQTARLKDASAHAEMIALSAAYNFVGDWRLEGCMMVSTLEPCTMCAGAISLSRIERIVFGARDPKFGACGSIFDVPREPKLNHQIEVVEGVLADEISELMKEFFRQVRQNREQIN